MQLRKEQGGAVIAGYEWASDGDVVEVPGDLGLELLAIKGGGFSEVLPQAEPADEPAAEEPAAGETAGGEESPDTAAEDKPKRQYKRRTPLAEQTPEAE